MVLAIRTGYKVREKYSTFVEYEYKGHKYEVEFANDYSYCVTPAHIQHADAQARIDAHIEREHKELCNAYASHDVNAVQDALESLWKYWNN